MSSVKVLELISRFSSIHTGNIIRLHKRLLLIPRVVFILDIPKELLGTKSPELWTCTISGNRQVKNFTTKQFWDPLLRMKNFTSPSSFTIAWVESRSTKNDRLSEKSQKTWNLYRDSTEEVAGGVVFFLYVIKLCFYLFLIKIEFLFVFNKIVILFFN